MTDLSAHLVTGTNNPSKQVSVDAWNDFIAALETAIGAASASDAELAALAGLTSAANKLPYFTGSGTAALTDLTAAGRALLDDANAAAQRSTLGVAIGTDVQAFNQKLADIAGASFAQGDILYHNGTNLVRLAAGTSGRFLKTNGAGANPAWAVATGLTPPASSDFSITLNSPTVADGTGSMMLTGANASGVLRGKLKAMPGGSFSVITKLKGRWEGAFNYGGILFRDTAGKYVILGIGAGASNVPQLFMSQWSAHSTFASDAFTGNFNGPFNDLPLWLKADYNASTGALTGSWSYANGPWVSPGSSTYLGTAADAYGVGINCNFATAPRAFFEHFETV